MVTKPEVARFVATIFPAVLKTHGAGVHRALIAFHTGALLEYVAKLKALDENAMALLLPAAMEPLETASSDQTEVKPTLLQESIVSLLFYRAFARYSPAAARKLPHPRGDLAEDAPHFKGVENDTCGDCRLCRTCLAKAARPYSRFDMCTSRPA